MTTVTSVELQKHFGPIREKALRDPVIVTHHGRESLVVMSVEEFRRLKALDTRTHYYAWDMPADIADALRRVKPGPESMAFVDEEA